MKTTTKTKDSTNKADLIQVDRALESFREAGYDLSAAVGEVVDNSIDARAQQIRVQTFEVESENGKRPKKSIDTIAFADNGMGITSERLPHCLTMGYSSRYGERKGIGRFGVGAKLAALSQARRVDIYSRPIGTQQVYHTFFDLTLIKEGDQKFLEAEAVDGFPEKYAHMMYDEQGHHSFESGTLVIWSDVDRLEEGGKFGSSVDERISELFKYLGRTYRRFISNGLSIVLNERPVRLHDPLFLLENPLAIELLRKEDWQGEIIQSDSVEVDSHEVEITVTILPEKVRIQRGGGASVGKPALISLYTFLRTKAELASCVMDAKSTMT